jgi:CopG family transcriptional regulator / antitoxin EndoAI
MRAETQAVHCRINISLPKETVKLLDRVARKGDRSRLINEAVRRYLTQVGRARLSEQLKAGYLQTAERDRHLAQDWFLIDEEVWQHDVP